MGLFNKIGRFLRHNVLNPAKTALSRSNVGQLVEGLVPGALDPNVNLFASPRPDLSLTAAVPVIAPVVGSTLQLPPPTVGTIGMTTIPTQHLQALIAEARAAQVLRGQLAALTSRVTPAGVPQARRTPVPQFDMRNLFTG